MDYHFNNSVDFQLSGIDIASPVEMVDPYHYPTIEYNTNQWIEVCIQKCKTISDILVDDWEKKVFITEFPSLIDTNKLVNKYSLQEINDILNKANLIPGEKDSIKKMRCKARNNVAAKNLRQKYKAQDNHLEKNLSKLIMEKETLESQKFELIREIRGLKQITLDLKAF